MSSIKKTLRNKVSQINSNINSCVLNGTDSICRGGLFSLLMVALIWISIFLYILFYYTYVPALSYTRPVHLQIEPCAEKNQEKCPFPSAHVRLTKKRQLLMVGQQYKLYVHLEMPESPTNQNLGMFMVCVNLTDKSGFVASKSCRSSMLHYNSDILRIISLVFFSPLYVFGFKQEKQHLTFELYSDYEEDQNHPATDVHVEILSRDAEVYSASLSIHAHLMGLRYFMYYWPTTSAFFGVLFNLGIMIFITMLSLYHQYFVQSVPSVALQFVLAKKLEEDNRRKIEEEVIKKTKEIESDTSMGFGKSPNYDVSPTQQNSISELNKDTLEDSVD